MAWVRIDDNLHAHPKILRAWQIEPASVGLYLLALSYAGRYLTDGAVPDELVDQLLPVSARRQRVTGALEHSGLWERNGDDWMIHDYLEFNDSRERILKKRKEDAARKRAGR